MRVSKFTQAEKIRIVKLAKRDGFKDAAKATKVSVPTLYNWDRALKKAGQGPYSNGHSEPSVPSAIVGSLKEKYETNLESGLRELVTEIVRQELEGATLTAALAFARS